jgi:DNA-binding IclR family transcriptional regulator
MTRDPSGAASGHTEGGETARRAFRLLEAVASQLGACTPSELAAMTGLSLSTTYRLVRILNEEQYVQRGPDGYRVGARLFGLAAAAMPQLAAFDALRPLMSELAARTGETVALHRRLGDSGVVIASQESSQHELRRVARVGTTSLLARNPAGHAILAGLPEHDLSTAVSRTVPHRQQAALLDQLADAARRGWAFAEESNQPGVHGLAKQIPIPPDPANAMALSVTGPSPRLTMPAAEKIAPLLTETSRQIAQVILQVRGETQIPG